MSLDSRVEFLTTERILVSLHQQLVAGISRRRSTFRSPPMHFNLDPTPTFSYSTLGFLFIHFFILFLRSLSLLFSLFSPPSSLPPPFLPSLYNSTSKKQRGFKQWIIPSLICRGWQGRGGEGGGKKERKERSRTRQSSQPMTPRVRISLKI